MATKLRIIETADYVLAVSDEEIKEGDKMYDSHLVGICDCTDVKGNLPYSYTSSFLNGKKIIAYQPKGNAPELDLPLLPEMVVEDDVEKLAKLEYSSPRIPDISKTYILERQAFKRGYKAATKTYSEEDLIEFSIWRSSTYTTEFHRCSNIKEQLQLWKSLKKPKGFVAEMQIVIHPANMPKEGEDRPTYKLKTARNPQGKPVLVGYYTNE